MPAHSIGDLIRRRGARKLVEDSPQDDRGAGDCPDGRDRPSQLPVITADGKAVGSVQEVTLARLLHDRRDPNTVKMEEVMARPLPTLDMLTHLDEAYRLLLAGYTGVLATDKDQVVDIITRIDLIHYWDKTREK